MDVDVEVDITIGKLMKSIYFLLCCSTSPCFSGSVALFIAAYCLFNIQDEEGNFFKKFESYGNLQATYAIRAE